jgi:N-dimethylarginine dimethylaminohydrolase
MKLDFLQVGGGGTTVAAIGSATIDCRVGGETETLRHVLLSSPAHLQAVPCCSATQRSLRDGFEVSADGAMAQHRRLRATLEDAGVVCHVGPAAADMPDLCFARDTLATSPWGLVVLNPALPHRRREVDHAVAAVATAGIAPVRRIRAGSIEGGDICIARPGLLVIGCSGERTDAAGAAEFAAPFATAGWDVVLCPFDPHFLHLDTIFCMLDANTALACTDVLEDSFIAAMQARGIALIPVTYKEARGLGCNILSIDGRTIVAAAGHDRVQDALRRHGFDPVAVDVAQFTACGGGIHCLTMPLSRVD